MLILGFHEFKNHIVSLGAGVATVNSVKKRSVPAIMKEEITWITSVWCVAQRLELAIQDALKDMFFD